MKFNRKALLFWVSTFGLFSTTHLVAAAVNERAATLERICSFLKERYPEGEDYAKDRVTDDPVLIKIDSKENPYGVCRLAISFNKKHRNVEARLQPKQLLGYYGPNLLTFIFQMPREKHLQYWKEAEHFGDTDGLQLVEPRASFETNARGVTTIHIVEDLGGHHEGLDPHYDALLLTLIYDDSGLAFVEVEQIRKAPQRVEHMLNGDMDEDQEAFFKAFDEWDGTGEAPKFNSKWDKPERPQDWQQVGKHRFERKATFLRAL
jgi:hypothetical protein